MKRKNSKAIPVCCLILFFSLLYHPALFATKYYSYQSGNWSGQANVWTTDSTGSTLVGPTTPTFANNDVICVLTGRTITLNANVSTTGHVITVVVGATLDLGTYTFTNAITLNGNGLVRTSRVSSNVATFPSITTGTFLTIEGGTVEYYPSSQTTYYIDDNRATYCHLVINLGSASQTMIVRRNLTLYGSMKVTTGVFQINETSNAKRTIMVYGSFTVESNAKVTTGTGNPNTSGYTINPLNLPPGGSFHTIFHELTIGGNFTNNGTVRFTNQTAPNYGEFPTNGAVTVRFTGEANATVTLNGITDFYNLIVDKGSDQTYILTVYSSSVNNFTLYGTNCCRRYEGAPYSADFPEVRKALWIKNGTLKLTGYILIPTLAEGPVGTGNSDYALGLAGQFWIAGPNVSVYTTASSATGFPEAPVGAQGVTVAGEQAFSIYGTFRISDGLFNARHGAGIIFWNTANSSSVVMVEGGTLNTSVLRSTFTAPGKTSYVQTGGTVIVRGDETEPGELYATAIFNIPNPSSTFLMTGGDIIIRDCNNGSTSNGNGLYLNCDPGNFWVTGGNVTFETNPVNTPSIDCYSRVNLWNLNVKRLGSTGNAVVNLTYDLNVANQLTIYDGATLSAGTGNFNVSVNGDFKINSGGTYTPNSNTTSSVGYNNTFLRNDGTITNGLYNLVVNKLVGSLILVAATDQFTIRNDLTISSGILADGGNSVYLYGNLYNSSTHVGAGKISLCKSTGTQIISGDGSGVFQNVEINNSYGSTGSAQVSLGADITITGVLNLANDRVFNLSKYQLSMTPLATINGTMSNNRFITTSGAPSDGGIRREFTDTIAFVYPVGSGTHYTPAKVHIKKIPSAYGTVTLKPVPGPHPFVTNPACLQAYWKLEESGFSGIQTGSIQLDFNYGNLGDNTAYVPGKYIPAVWTYLNDVSLVNETTKLITFPSEDTFAGDYTSGIPAAFGAVLAFYSRANGNWNVPSTWSNAGYGGTAAITVPGAGNPVFIGDGSAYNHTVTLTTGKAFSGSLSIKSGSVLDVDTTTGNNFGTVLPESLGKLRISARSATPVFPAGDFGSFLGANGGTVEYYTKTLGFTLPTVTSAPTSRPITTYCNLMLTPGTGYKITMPNSDLVIYKNMTVSGASSTALVGLNAGSATTLTIKSNLAVNGGNLVFQNNYAQTVRIDKNLTIATDAIFNVAGTGTAVNNSISFGGNITNNGTLDLSVSSTIKCDALFTGNSSSQITGRGTITDFYSLTLNKGTSIAPVLTVNSSAFTFSNNSAPLTLVNGTFRLTSAVTVTVATMGLDIPATTCLSANGGTIQVGTTSSDDADVTLAGLIEVRSGGITIGNASNSVNNDIEYSGAGYPAIEVSGGTLFVNGQIRRSLINGLGSLVYNQWGGGVVINGRNVKPSRAKLEVLNSGSTFNMSDGTITIVRGASTTFNDLYLRPDIYSVTGGTIIFGNTTTENSTTNVFTMDSQIPLYNITVDGTTNAKTVTLSVHGITLQGSLTINGSSVFRADSLDVNIEGDLVNNNPTATTGVNVGGYQTGSFRQVTRFVGNAGNQVIQGTSTNLTNFAMLIINNTYPGGTVTMQNGTAGSTLVRVNGDLTLTNGTLADGGYVIAVVGDISNSAAHFSTGSGRLLLTGSVVQYISGNGNGKFGNLYLNANYDVRMTASMEITGVLTFQGTSSNYGKLLDIGNKLLILSNTSASAVVALSPAVFSATCCIRSDGLVSDAGVRKSYPATTSSVNFTFPSGVPGKYVPATMDVRYTTVPGTITMIPVNSQHPCNTGTGTNILQFYWHVISSGFASVNIYQYYTYVQADVKGTESYYTGDRYNYVTGLWDSPTSGTAINTTTNLITFGNKSFIDGDYTAGQSSEFGTVLVYYSRNATCTSPSSGNWDATATWSTDAVNQHAGAAASSYPTGEPVVIATNHIVNTNGNLRKSSKVTLNGTGLLNLSNSVGHDLGTVTGTGTIKLSPSATGFYVFPAGFFSAFMAPGGGTVELNSASGTSVFPYLTTYNNLVLSGAGIKKMIDADITLNGTLTNQAASSFTASAVGKLILNSNWINDGNFSHNNGSVYFNGTSAISGSTSLVLNNMTISQGAGLTAPSSTILGIAGNFTNDGTFDHNSGTVNFTGTSTIGGLSNTTFNNVTIASGKTLTGKLSDNFTLIGDWTNNGTFNHNGGGVVFDGTTLVSGSSATTFGNINITGAGTLTGPSAGTLGVALNFYNDGIFVNNGGTLVFSGATQELSGGSSTLFENITVNSGSNTSINTYGQTLRGVLLCNGSLNANDNITLLSDSTQTALVDGSGTGDVSGNLTMQRYLSRGFGYKYFSSPFQYAEVGQFGNYMNLYEPFPTFYRYDENRMFTGWITYTDPTGILNPMEGYAVNFGPVDVPVTVALNGVVNNNTLLPVTMFNRNHPFTLGFNLIGNPYPSPIDWDAATWIRSNIDNALYYFNAGTTDQYTGTYSTYINGISSDGHASNIIPAMQGFFMHVSDGTYPVAATLIFTNNVRVNNLSPYFHKAVQDDSRPLLRIEARYGSGNAKGDPAVIYFDPDATPSFDKDRDALKLMNTDVLVPNLYVISDMQQMSINGMPYPVDSLTIIPLGLKTRQAGQVIFNALNIRNMPPNLWVYLFDNKNGVHQNLFVQRQYSVYLDTADYQDRFAIVFSKKDLRLLPGSEVPFYIYSYRNRIYVYIGTDDYTELSVHNMLGQTILKQSISGRGYHELDMNASTGIYVVSLNSVNQTYTKKVYLHDQF